MSFNDFKTRIEIKKVREKEPTHIDIDSDQETLTKYVYTCNFVLLDAFLNFFSRIDFFEGN